MTHERMAKVVVFTTVVEAGTGLALLVDPALIVALLLGVPADTTVRAVGRCFGISLLALAAAWWPDRGAVASAPASSRGRLIYNAGIALFLGLIE